MAALNFFNISEEAIKVIEENSTVKSTKDAPEFGKKHFLKEKYEVLAD